MSREELLLKLRDLQSPPQPDWWQLAPAQLLLSACLLALLIAGWVLLRRRRSNRLVQIANLELRQIESGYRRHRDERQLAIQLSGWLRQVAILAYPTVPLQGLCGDAWLEFLDRALGERRFSHGCGRIFGAEVYRLRPDYDADQVCALCRHWLQALRPRLRQRGNSP